MYTIVLHNLTAMKTHVAKYTRTFPLCASLTIIIIMKLTNIDTQNIEYRHNLSLYHLNFPIDRNCPETLSKKDEIDQLRKQKEKKKNNVSRMLYNPNDTMNSHQRNQPRHKNVTMYSIII